MFYDVDRKLGMQDQLKDLSWIENALKCDQAHQKIISHFKGSTSQIINIAQQYVNLKQLNLQLCRSIQEQKDANEKLQNEVQFVSQMINNQEVVLPSVYKRREQQYLIDLLEWEQQKELYKATIESLQSTADGTQVNQVEASQEKQNNKSRRFLKMPFLLQQINLQKPANGTRSVSQQTEDFIDYKQSLNIEQVAIKKSFTVAHLNPLYRQGQGNSANRPKHMRVKSCPFNQAYDITSTISNGLVEGPVAGDRLPSFSDLECSESNPLPQLAVVHSDLNATINSQCHHTQYYTANLQESVHTHSRDDLVQSGIGNTIQASAHSLVGVNLADSPISATSSSPRSLDDQILLDIMSNKSNIQPRNRSIGCLNGNSSKACKENQSRQLSLSNCQRKVLSCARGIGANNFPCHDKPTVPTYCDHQGELFQTKLNISATGSALRTPLENMQQQQQENILESFSSPQQIKNATLKKQEPGLFIGQHQIYIDTTQSNSLVGAAQQQQVNLDIEQVYRHTMRFDPLVTASSPNSEDMLPKSATDKKENCTKKSNWFQSMTSLIPKSNTDTSLLSAQSGLLSFQDCTSSVLHLVNQWNKRASIEDINSIKQFKQINESDKALPMSFDMLMTGSQLEEQRPIVDIRRSIELREKKMSNQDDNAIIRHLTSKIQSQIDTIAHSWRNSMDYCETAGSHCSSSSELHHLNMIFNNKIDRAYSTGIISQNKDKLCLQAGRSLSDLLYYQGTSSLWCPLLHAKEDLSHQDGPSTSSSIDIGARSNLSEKPTSLEQFSSDTWQLGTFIANEGSSSKSQKGELSSRNSLQSVIIHSPTSQDASNRIEELPQSNNETEEFPLDQNLFSIRSTTQHSEASYQQERVYDNAPRRPFQLYSIDKVANYKDATFQDTFCDAFVSYIKYGQIE